MPERRNTAEESNRPPPTRTTAGHPARRIVTIAVAVLIAGVLGSTLTVATPLVPSTALAAPVAPTAWVHLTTPSPPSDRDQVMMAYDPVISKVVLFGGYDPAISPLGDTWTYHAGTWTHLAISGPSPPARWAAGFVYDPQLHGMLLFGGRNLTKFFNDTWLFNGTAWSRISTPSSVAPSPRSEPAMAYDPSTGRLLLFGGGIGNLPAGSSSPWTYFSDTWTLNGHRWTNITAAVGASPSARFGAQLGWDPVDRYMFLEGGNILLASGTSQPVNDSWSFSGGTWTHLATIGAPPTVVSANGGGMTWDVKAGEFILYGREYGSVISSQTWTYVGGSWTNITSSLLGVPTPRSSTGFTDDVSDGYVLMFAGSTPPPNYTYRVDAWSLI
jgi:hypothetical protein